MSEWRGKITLKNQLLPQNFGKSLTDAEQFTGESMNQLITPLGQLNTGICDRNAVTSQVEKAC